MEQTNSTTATKLTKKQLKALDRITNRAPKRSRPPFFVRLGTEEPNAICFTDGYSAVLLPMNVKSQLDECFGAHEYTDFFFPEGLIRYDVLEALIRLDPSTKPTEKYSELVHSSTSTPVNLSSVEDTRNGIPYTNSGLYNPCSLRDVWEAVGTRSSLWLGGSAFCGTRDHAYAYFFPEDKFPSTEHLPFGVLLPIFRNKVKKTEADK